MPHNLKFSNETKTQQDPLVAKLLATPLPMVGPEVIAAIKDTRVVKDSLFILSKLIAHSQGVKLTATRALNRNFVEEFFRSLPVTSTSQYQTVRTERDCRELTFTRFLLTVSGFIIDDGKSIVISPAGEFVFSKKDYLRIYLSLIEVATFNWQWGYGDRYDDFEFIQESAMYLLRYIVHTKNPEVSASEIFDTFFKIEPLSEIENPPPINSENREDYEFFLPQNQAKRALRLRFLERFCVPFGLVESLPEDSQNDYGPTVKYSKTKLLVDYFSNFVIESSFHSQSPAESS